MILTATSGDTGKAAMAGFADVKDTQIIVFYPKDGVSEVQEKQMRSQTGANTHVVAITGNFDDAQTKVKEIFDDPDMALALQQKGYRFSSLIPSISGVYSRKWSITSTLMAKCSKLVRSLPDKQSTSSVQREIFGDILAGWYAKNSGYRSKIALCFK